MNKREAITKTALELGLPRDRVQRIYMAYWKAIREHIIALPLKDKLTDEELSKLKPNINIPSIGKLYVNVDKYNAMKKSYQTYINELAEQQSICKQNSQLLGHQSANC